MWVNNQRPMEVMMAIVKQAYTGGKYTPIIELVGPGELHDLRVILQFYLDNPPKEETIPLSTIVFAQRLQKQLV